MCNANVSDKSCAGPHYIYQPSPPPPTPVPEATLVVDTIVSDIMAEAMGARRRVYEEANSTKPKRALPCCHECHGPIRGYHQEYPHGLNICEL